MLLESMIDHEYPLAMKMEVEAPMVSLPPACLSPARLHLPAEPACSPFGLTGAYMLSPCFDGPSPLPCSCPLPTAAFLLHCPPLQLTEMLLEEMEMPGQHLPAPDAPDMVRAQTLGLLFPWCCHCS
jgi:hypothetical protein